MEEFKQRAGEKLEALHVAAKTAADGGKSRVHNAFTNTGNSFRRVKEAFLELWNNEFVVESRECVADWMRDAVRRIREGTPPLSPVLLYEDLVGLFKDRVWRRSMVIFLCGAALGGGAGLCLGLGLASPAPLGPHSRALHSQSDQTVILVDDAVTSVAGAGEVLIRVQAVSVEPVDRNVLRGRGSGLRSLINRNNLTVGRGFAGVVLDVGPGVNELEMGDEVWGCVSEWAGGAASELLTIRSTRVSKRPRAAAADRAATLPWAGAQALHALRALALTPHSSKDKRVAICGASSSVGCVLIQLLSSWGAHLTVLAPRRAAATLQALGAHEFIDLEDQSTCWQALEAQAARGGPWHAALACPGAGTAECPNAAALLKATTRRRAIMDLRPRPFYTDHLPLSCAVIFSTSFIVYRLLRWMVGLGTHTDWLEDRSRLTDGLRALTDLVDEGKLAPVLDKVYVPQDFEDALAHACSADAIGTTVIRFP